MSKPFMKVTEDRTDELLKLINSYRNSAVLVGIPEDKSERSIDPESGMPVINNATLLFINNFGSPGQNIPARPVMSIGIRGAQDLIAAEFANALMASLSQGLSAISTYYERAGIVASNSVKRAINDQLDIDPPSEATLKSRESRGFKGTKALLVTGQMRNAITYVVNVGGL